MTPILKFLSATLAITAMASPLQALAQDEGLYDAPIDPNSAFVRVLAPGAAVATVNGTTVDGLTGGLSAYVNVEPGAIDVAAGDATGTLTASPGAYYTYALPASGEPVLLEDEAANDPSKATVYFYNLSDKPMADLFVPSAKVNAIESVAAAEAKSVALKAPLKLDMEVVADGATVARVAQLDLKRRGGVTIILSGTEGNYLATAVENTFFRAE